MSNYSLRENLLTILILLLGFTNTTFSQKVKIKKVLDSNLFELENGKLVKLAGIDVPNLNNKNPNLKIIASKAYLFAKDKLKRKSLDVVYLKNCIQNTSSAKVLFYRYYPLVTIDFTEEYLLHGFGKFVNNCNIPDTDKYIKAELKAKQEKKGLWELDTKFDSTLDQTNGGENILAESTRDSIVAMYKNSPIFKKIPQSSRIFIETFAGPTLGIIGSIGGAGSGAITGSIAGEEGWGMLGYVMLGGYLGYLVGSSYGIYLVANGGERDVTFGYSFLASFIGGISGIYIMSTTNGFNQQNIGTYAPLFLPVIASILYANLIAPKKEQAHNSVSFNRNQLPVKNYFTHNDFYNSTKLIEISLFRISF